MTYPEAKIGLCQCHDNKTFGIRLEKSGNNWKATWAFPIKKPGSEKRENYDKTQLNGLIEFDNEYPGCPYCGSKAFIICGTCGGLNCNSDIDSESFTCKWCGATGVLQDYTGDGFSAGGDR